MCSCPKHVLHPAIQGKKIDTVYLDTTYLNPQVSLDPDLSTLQVYIADLSSMLLVPIVSIASQLNLR
jgi:hypothetical protein